MNVIVDRHRETAARRPGKLDEFDIRILATLQINGRMTKLNLAEAIGLSASPCWERLRKLEEAGIIRGYHADVAIDRLMTTSLVFVEVTLRAHQAQDFRLFENAIAAIPEVIECYATGGGVDYLLKVAAADIDHYQRVIDTLLAADIGIYRYFTYIVTKPVKHFSGYPLERLVNGARGAAALDDDSGL